MPGKPENIKFSESEYFNKYTEGKGKPLAHLTDMEELLAKIPRADIRDYMREAMNCYMAGAYRGSLVLSYIALFDDLLAKLKPLASINATAKTIFSNANKKKTDQNVYERYLIDQLTTNNLISGLDSSFLKTLSTLRNKSAHPSGHKPSPEEARFIFFETIDRFLSKPILSTSCIVDDLIVRLKNTNFFPGNVIPDIKNVVNDEIAGLHNEALPQLVEKMIASVTSSNVTEIKNASFFLIGLAMIDKPEANLVLQTKLLEAKADDAAYQSVIIQAISANGKLIANLTSKTIVRVRSMLSSKISEVTSDQNEAKLSHPTATLIAIAGAMPEVDFVTTFKPELEAIFKKRAHSEFLVNLVEKKPSLLEIYVPIMLKAAGSSDFTTANSFSEAVEALDAPLSKLLTEEFAFKLVLAIMQAASCNAWAAKAVVNAKFAGTPLLRGKECSFIAADEAAAAKLIEEMLGSFKTMKEFVAFRLTDDEGV